MVLIIGILIVSLVTTEVKAEIILVSEISKCISEAEVENLESFYLEILAKPGYKKNPKKIITIDT